MLMLLKPDTQTSWQLFKYLGQNKARYRLFPIGKEFVLFLMFTSYVSDETNVQVYVVNFTLFVNITLFF